MMKVLLILMWKHKVVRVRRWILTILEFVVPLLFFLLLLFVKTAKNVPKTLNEDTESDELNEVSKMEIMPLADMMPAPHWIMYYPDTRLTKMLMDEVGAKLKLKRITTYPAHPEGGYFAYGNESGVPDLAAKMRIMDAIVIFQDMSGKTWPGRLNYTIRMKGDFGTNESLYSTLDPLGPQRLYGLKYGTFMRIQWAIDTSYIKLLTGNEVPQVVSLQEFPNGDDIVMRSNPIRDLMLTVMPFFCWYSLLLNFTLQASRLLQEKTSGIQELLRMVGVPPATLRLSHVLNVCPVGLVWVIVATLCMTLAKNPLILYSSWILVAVLMCLHFNFVISMAFLFSSVFGESAYSGAVSVLLYILAELPAQILNGYIFSSMPYKNMILLVSVFLPKMPLYFFWAEIASHESKDKGANFSNMASTHTDTVSILICYIILLVQIGFCYSMTWYLSIVRPGKFGLAKPWNFFLKAEYWKKNQVTPETVAREVKDPQYFEPAPPNSIPGIKIVNVSKMYPKHQALKNVSLDVYKGDITVLLGHNGAGKTTLMSIITGMTSATHGKVYVMGKDTVTQGQEVRKHLGLCPQHNVFFGDLTVREHIMFYTLLRESGRKNLSMKTIAEAEVSSEELAEKLSLSGKRNSMVSQLSGGMKRRLQLGCALAGGADVVVLDEPTSGLDVENRRVLWDLLLSLRGNRTVLLSTHYMEEADALGDRVAAIKNGELKCSATTMHLKKALGTGYRLSFVTTGAPQEEAITRVVTSHVPTASLKERTIYSLVYNVPVTDTGKFPDLFAALEERRSELQIESMAIGVATLEEVFMKLCSDIDTTLTEDEVDSTLVEPVVSPEKKTGLHLYLRQFYVLLKRQVKYIWHRKYSFIFLQFLLPIFVLALITFATNNSLLAPTPTSLAMNLDMYGDREGSRVMYHVKGPDVTRQDVEIVRLQFPEVTFEETNDIATAILRTSREDILEYNDYLAGVEVNDTNAKVLYTTTVRHAAPVALNLLSNMLAHNYMMWSDGKTITTINDPIRSESQQEQKKEQVEPKGLALIYLWTNFHLFIILCTNINSVSLPCTERETGTRHIHVMSGCPVTLLWLSAIFFHAVTFMLTTMLPIVLIAVLLDKDRTIDQPDFLFAYTILMLLGSMAFVAFGYIVSFNFETGTTIIILIAWIFLFGIITPSIELLVELPGILSYLFYPADYLCVPHTVNIAAIRALYAARMNARCKNYKQYCPFLPFQIPEEMKKCCAGLKPGCYFCFGEEKPGVGMLVVTLQLVVFMTIVVLTELGFFNGLWDKLRNMNYIPLKGAAEKSEMVLAEAEYVKKTITLRKNQIPDSLLAYDLHKVYVPLRSRKIQAVKGVSFSVKKGECFGLLGINGAGKSTVFKMLTAEEVATRGKIFANGEHMSPGNTRYLKTLGYCPQFFGLDYFLTGEDNLEMILTLRGYDTKSVKEEIENWIQIVGLEKYARNKVNSYSGGCVRRMGAAAALCSDADLALLDEPNAGVDPAARRRVWTALRKALRRQRSIIITSHSLDEMEALCHRIAIMTRGRVRALGTPTGLRAAHAQGYAAMFKLTNAGVADGENILDKFKERIHKEFNCTLRDEHVTMLHYHINDKLRLSDLFIALESLRRDFPGLIEDYSVSETTLEEVFLALAKENPLNS